MSLVRHYLVLLLLSCWPTLACWSDISWADAFALSVFQCLVVILLAIQFYPPWARITIYTWTVVVVINVIEFAGDINCWGLDDADAFFALNDIQWCCSTVIISIIITPVMFQFLLAPMIGLNELLIILCLLAWTCSNCMDHMHIWRVRMPFGFWI